jgi:hypothetical protein
MSYQSAAFLSRPFDLVKQPYSERARATKYELTILLHLSIPTLMNEKQWILHSTQTEQYRAKYKATVYLYNPFQRKQYHTCRKERKECISVHNEISHLLLTIQGL